MSLSARSAAAVEPVDPNEVPFVVSEVSLVRYFQVAVITVLVYDTIITMDKEVKHFWKIPRKAVDFLYFVNRYIGILGAVAFIFFTVYSVDITIYDLGNLAIWMRDTANWTTAILIDYILMIRVLALYSGDRRLSLFLMTILAMEAGFKLAIFIYSDLKEEIVVGGLAKDITICGTDGFEPNQWSIVDWVMPMAYGFILMVLALYKASEYWRMSARFKGFTLVKVLIEDQLLYFFLAVGSCVVNLLNVKFVFSNEFLGNALNAIGDPEFLCVLGSRMLINLKEAGERGQNEGTSYRVTSRTVSEMDFAQGNVEENEQETIGV